MSFHREHCEGCPYREQCKPPEHKKTFRKTLSVKSKQRAIQQWNRKSNVFKAYSRFWNGVESIPSILRRKYHVDKQDAGSRTYKYKDALWPQNRSIEL